MQKKIIALAIAAVMAAPAVAMAEATVYGQANMAIEITDNGSDTTSTSVGNAADSRTQISSNVSRIGVKGSSEDLGGGMTAIWQMEGQVNLDDGTGVSGAGTSLFNRNTFAGLTGGFGTVVLGRHDTPYKMSTRKLDMFADTIADNRSIMGNGHDARLSNVLAYLSPDISGFNAAVALVLGTDNTFGGAATTETSATSLSLQYGMDAWSVILANQTIDSTDSVVPGNKYNSSATKLGGTFAMDMFSVGLVYEMLADKDGAGTKVEKNDIYIGGKVKVGDAGAVKLGYTMASEWKVGGVTGKNSEGSQVSLGYDHALGKNTTVYALYSSVSNGTVNGTSCGGGCVVPSYGLNGGGSTGDTAPGPLVAGGVGNPNAVAFGIKHSF